MRILLVMAVFTVTVSCKQENKKSKIVERMKGYTSLIRLKESQLERAISKRMNPDIRVDSLANEIVKHEVELSEYRRKLDSLEWEYKKY